MVLTTSKEFLVHKNSHKLSNKDRAKTEVWPNMNSVPSFTTD